MRNKFSEEISWKVQLGNPNRWEDKIKMDLREVGCENECWMILAQDHVVMSS
jgi:hypothetical protein